MMPGIPEQLPLTPEQAKQVHLLAQALEEARRLAAQPPEPIKGGSVDSRPAWQRCPRPAQVYKGETMLNTAGKVAIPFVISEKCGVKLQGGVVCGLQLLVTRLKNIRFLDSDDHLGGQLDYDNQSDFQMLIKYCPQHTTSFPTSWDSDGKFVEKIPHTMTSHEGPARQGP